VNLFNNFQLTSRKLLQFKALCNFSRNTNIVDSNVNVENHIQQPASKIEVLSELIANTCGGKRSKIEALKTFVVALLH